jgi:hypothetical protein
MLGPTKDQRDGGRPHSVGWSLVVPRPVRISVAERRHGPSYLTALVRLSLLFASLAALRGDERGRLELVRLSLRSGDERVS